MGWHQGTYNVQNREKYLGYSNPTFRSGWERTFMYFLDSNSEIIKWNSEGTRLPYISNLDNKKHSYFVDFYFEKKVGDKIYKVLAEVKPYAELFPPQLPKTRSYKSMKSYNYRIVTFNKNKSKWISASSFARNAGMEFYILTEKGIFCYGSNGPYKVSDKVYF